jgi:methanogenic corrinoid protein MtbC1
MHETLDSLKQSLLDLDMDAALAHAHAILDGAAGVSAQDGVNAVAAALQVVGKRFQEGAWFVGELVYAGEIAKSAMQVLSPALAAGATGRLGTIVVGTVAGDLHDLGKNIFVGFARSSGFEIVDLGVNVAAARFVDAVKAHQPLAVGMSCLLTTTAGEVGTVVEALRAAGVRNRVKVIIGGAALTEQFAREVAADAFAPDAVTGTDIVKGWSAA